MNENASNEYVKKLITVRLQTETYTNICANICMFFLEKNLLKIMPPKKIIAKLSELILLALNVF